MEEKGGNAVLDTVLPGSDRGSSEKVFTHVRNVGCRYILSYVALLLLAQSYFILQFLLRINFYDNVQEFSIIYQKAHEELMMFMDVMNVYREYYANSQSTIGRSTALKETVNVVWQELSIAQKEYQSVRTDPRVIARPSQ